MAEPVDLLVLSSKPCSKPNAREAHLHDRTLLLSFSMTVDTSSISSVLYIIEEVVQENALPLPVRLTV